MTSSARTASARDRVLVVDDDPDIREMLQSTLGFAGFDVSTAHDVSSAVRAVAAGTPDVIVLDVMMPGADGFDLLQLLRQRGDLVPVLFLTARDAVEDRVRGLRLGADDYVTKPFSVVEVAARVEALVRRSRAAIVSDTTAAAADSEVLRCGDLEVDAGRHRVSRAGVALDLSPTEYRLLTYLLVNAGRVVSKGQMLDHVWNYDFGGDTNVVERFVSNLRRKIDQGSEPLIHTVRGFGYSIREPGS